MRTAINHSGPGRSLLAFAHTYDANGARTSVTKNGGTPESYTLDSLNRLANVTYADGTTQSYTCDANGNRPAKTQRGTTTMQAVGVRVAQSTICDPIRTPGNRHDGDMVESGGLGS